MNEVTHSAPFTLSRAAASEWPAVCRLLFPETNATPPSDQILASRDPTAVFVARDSAGQLRAAALVQALPGALGVAWPPRGDSPTATAAVLRAACEWLRGSRVKVCQAFPETTTSGHQALWERCGFRRTTQLVFLEYDCRQEGLPAQPPRQEFALVAIHDPLQPDFTRTVLATHEDTNDCPELNHSRTPEQIVEGMVSLEGQWFLAQHDSEAVGVMNLKLNTDRNVVELQYLGVVPAQRRRGYGSDLLKYAILGAIAAQTDGVTVAVDARNTAARHLYTHGGFVERDRREVWLAHLGEAKRK
ncbi:MAG: GNAT family N-acetyltransferase [Gemmataceae bacterium]|nr:GNAT family N-acetyltransferase [Gemmata sp.]MDW8196317.1 GNAT family N-acetyltransferase [Gemmataceae bacterium]